MIAPLWTEIHTELPHLSSHMWDQVKVRQDHEGLGMFEVFGGTAAIFFWGGGAAIFDPKNLLANLKDIDVLRL